MVNVLRYVPLVITQMIMNKFVKIARPSAPNVLINKYVRLVLPPMYILTYPVSRIVHG